MKANEIIKKMLGQGLTPEQIKESLRELGFENADELVEAAAGGKTEKEASAEPEEREEAAEPEETGEKKPSDEDSIKELLSEGKEEGEEPPAGLMGDVVEKPRERKSLFEKKKAAPAKEEEPAEEPEEPEEEKTETPPELKITSVTEEGEKEIDIQQMLSKASELPKGATLSPSEAGSLKQKLDETIALLKALEEVNKKILETDREVLMRLKKD